MGHLTEPDVIAVVARWQFPAGRPDMGVVEGKDAWPSMKARIRSASALRSSIMQSFYAGIKIGFAGAVSTAGSS